MAKGVSVTLYDVDGNAYASGTNIAVMWFDSSTPPDLDSIVGRSATATTTSGGVLSLDLDIVTGLDVVTGGFWPATSWTKTTTRIRSSSPRRCRWRP